MEESLLACCSELLASAAAMVVYRNEGERLSSEGGEDDMALPMLGSSSSDRSESEAGLRLREGLRLGEENDMER